MRVGWRIYNTYSMQSEASEATEKKAPDDDVHKSQTDEGSAWAHGAIRLADDARCPRETQM